MAERSRFASLEEDDILKIIDDKDMKATKNVTAGAARKCTHMKMYCFKKH